MIEFEKHPIRRQVVRVLFVTDLDNRPPPCVACSSQQWASVKKRERPLSSGMLGNVSTGCAAGDVVCRRVQAFEPSLPLHPSFSPDILNPCIASSATRQMVCLPYVHVIAGWHMFSDEALSWLRHIKQIEVRNGAGCFDDWAHGDDGGGSKWVTSWGGPPNGGASSVLMAHCNKLLGWYPAFAGRYTAKWGEAYGPCKEREMKKPGDYYDKYMWQVCRPEALRAHDAAMGTGGAGKEATPPFVMRALYGTRVRVISAIRNPVDRLEVGANDRGCSSAAIALSPCRMCLGSWLSAARHCESAHGIGARGSAAR